MNTLCIQYGTSRVKTTLWDAKRNLKAFQIFGRDERSSLKHFLSSMSCGKVLISDISGHFPLEPEVTERATLISREDLRAYCDYPKAQFYRVGLDRLLFTAAVVKEGLAPCVAIDFGTHTTVNSISKAGKLVGGWIVPGLSVWKRSSEWVSPQLATPQTPFCFVEVACDSYPQTTEEALLAGFLQSYQGLFSSIRKLQLPLVVTGGYAEMFQKLLPLEHSYDPFWIERGMLTVAHASYRSLMSV